MSLQNILLDEIVILDAYFPEQLGEAELRSLAAQIIDQVGPHLGQVMKLLIPQTRGRAEGAFVKKIVEGMIR